jgi:hypothetical protein
MIYVYLICYMWVVQKARGIISIKYRPLSVNWVEWKVALKPRRKIILSAKFISV